jgi:hypothetical protein
MIASSAPRESSRRLEEQVLTIAWIATQVLSATTALASAPPALPEITPTQLILPASFAPPANFLALPPLTAPIVKQASTPTLGVPMSASPAPTT